MQISPPLKKKKYVKKKVKEQILSHQKLQQLSRDRFDYTFDEIVNILLCKILPDQRFIIRLSQKLIFGQQKQLQQIINKMNQNIKYYTGFIIQLFQNQQKQDIQYLIQDYYKAKLYNSKLIQKIIYQFFKGSKYQLQCNSFIKILQSQTYIRLFVRISKQYQEQFLDKIKQKAKIIEQINISDKQPIRGNRLNYNIEIISQIIDSNIFNPQQFKKYIHKNDKLQRKDIEIIQNKNQYGFTNTYTIKLSCREQFKQRKLQAFKFYFKQQSFVKLPSKNTQHKTQLIKKYDGYNQDGVQIKRIKAFKSSKWDDKTLIYKIRFNNISNKKSHYHNEIFEGLHIIGLLPKVRQYIQILQQQINNVPLDDIKQQIFLDFEDDIKDAIKNNQLVQKYIYQYIKDYLQKFKNILDIISIKFPLRGIKLNLLIKPNKDKQFHSTIKNDIKQLMLKQISINRSQVDFIIDQQFIKKIKKQKIVIIDQGDKYFTYIGRNSQKANNIEKIKEIQRQFMSFTQEYIDIQGKFKLNKYLNLIYQIQKNNQLFNLIYITQPDTQDKIHFKIGFIGPGKKNIAFLQEIKKNIFQIQKKQSTYHQSINQQQANFLIKDSYIGQKILQQYNIPLFIDPNYLFDAVLQVEPIENKKIIYIKNYKKLDLLPINSKVFFIGRQQLDCFDDKILDILKMKVKRMTRNDIIIEIDPRKNIQYYFKQEMNQIQLIFQALKNQVINQNNKSICFFFPQNNKSIFLSKILKILQDQKIYRQLKYQIYIFQIYQTADIKSIVNIPQFTGSILPQKQTIYTQWYCQKYPYSKIGNNKINNIIANGLTKCIIQQQDLQIIRTLRTHIIDLSKKILICTKNLKQYPLIIDQNGYKFSVSGQIYQFSKKAQNLIKSYSTIYSQTKFNINLHYYQLDLLNMEQTNIFTGKKRKIQKIQKKLASSIQQEDLFKIRAFYDYKIPQIIYSFEEDKTQDISSIITQIQDYIKQSTVEEKVSIKRLGGDYQLKVNQMIKSKAQQYSIKYEYNQKTSILVAKSLNFDNFQKFKNLIQAQIEYLAKLQNIENLKLSQKHIQEIVFPSHWQPQSKQIQIFQVKPDTYQFIRVQKLFILKPIHKLHRIQNKFLYQKYNSQLNHLTFLNSNQKPKQMQLFHGTRDTEPETIWGDKQQGFNINYSSDSNLLGRGIYFAEKAQYSQTYSHKKVGSPYRQMFLCNVIVGESQQMKMTSDNSHVKDTNINNKNGLKYQSMRGKHHICDIYVVYKDKRAYPAYLIQF